MSVTVLRYKCCESNSNKMFTLSYRMTYNLDFGRVSNVIPAHDDAVSTLKMLPQLGILVSGSWDCSVKYVLVFFN